MAKDYGSWTMAKLKDELRKRNAKLTGKKATLVQRLEDYDKLFGPLVSNPESVYKISVPDPGHFMDITFNSLVPDIDMDDLKSFCQQTERKDVDTSEKMYREYFLMSCRIAKQSNDFFFTGMVKSEMRKNIIYNVTIRLKNHNVLEAQCECAAGMGPYAQCKHILVLLFGIIELKSAKKIQIRNSITSNLQTFHQPRNLYSGKPIKAEELKLKSNSKNYEALVKFDPRPATRVSDELYAENFNKEVTNFICLKKDEKSLPISNILEHGHKRSIFLDHDYLKTTAEEMFLQPLNDNELAHLENITKNNKKVWLFERTKRLQSSNFGNICKTKSGQKKLATSLATHVDICTAPIKHGLKYEKEAVREFEKIMNLTTVQCGLIIYKEHQFLACTPDRLIGKTSVLEVKCPYTARGQMISPETVSYLYLCDMTGHFKLSEKHNYFYQVQGQMMCTGRTTAYFCVYTIKDIIIIKIARDDKFISEMYDVLIKFYDEYFKKVVLDRYLYNIKY